MQNKKKTLVNSKPAQVTLQNPFKPQKDGDIVMNSRDYKKIRIIPLDGLNRKISRPNVAKLKLKMIKNGFTTIIDVIRTRAFSKDGSYKMFILDGQHRFTSAEQLDNEIKGGFGFNFIIKELKEDTIENIRDLIIDANDCSHNWQNNDYLMSGYAIETKKGVKNGLYQAMHKALKFRSPATGIKLKNEDAMHIFVGGTTPMQIAAYRYRNVNFGNKERIEAEKKLSAITKPYGGTCLLDCVTKSYTRRSVYKMFLGEMDGDYDRVAKFIVEHAKKALRVSTAEGKAISNVLPSDEQTFFNQIMPEYTKFSRAEHDRTKKKNSKKVVKK